MDAATVCAGLLRDSCALAVTLVDAAGRALAQAGDARYVELAAAAPSPAAAADREVYERRDDDTSRYALRLPSGAIVTVLFDERSSLGLVRLRVRAATPALSSARVLGTT